MKKFMMIDVFNRSTGERIPNGHRSHVGFYCDYCGKEEDLNGEMGNSISFSAKENGGAEESWYYHEFGRQYLDTFSFWSQQDEYHYCIDEVWSNSCSGKMIKKAVKNKEANLLHNAMQLARIKVVNNLLENGVDSYILGFEEDE